MYLFPFVPARCAPIRQPNTIPLLKNTDVSAPVLILGFWLNSLAYKQSVFSMQIHRYSISSITRILILTSVLALLALNSNRATASDQQPLRIDGGYSALKLFLEDEKHLTTIRWVKTIITFDGISDHSTKLIDDIADSSKQALDELEQLAMLKPSIVFEEFSDESIGKATLDSLRMGTAKDFLLYTDDFEKSLLISQSQILPVICHLARQLEEKETNSERKAWLQKLANDYEQYYQQVYTRISIENREQA